MAGQVYELAGQQDNPLAEEVLAILFTDRPTTVAERPKDSRRHGQFFARDPVGQSSRIWVGFAAPLTDDTPGELKGRAELALAHLVPEFASKIEVTATQTAADTVALDVTITIPRQEDITIGLVITGT